jgi:hypothetical protein|nr:MAG TPA: hypothetical protein [Crassvirales sp.]
MVLPFSKVKSLPNIRSYRNKVCKTFIYALKYYGNDRVIVHSNEKGDKYALIIHYPEVKMHSLQSNKDHTIKDIYVCFTINNSGYVYYPKGIRMTLTEEEFNADFYFPHLYQLNASTTVGDFCLGNNSPLINHYNYSNLLLNDNKELSEEWFITLFTLMDQYLTIETTQSAYCRISRITNTKSKLISIHDYIKVSNRYDNINILDNRNINLIIANVIFELCDKNLYLYETNKINDIKFNIHSIFNYPIEQLLIVTTNSILNRLKYLKGDEYDLIKSLLITAVESDRRIYMKENIENNKRINNFTFTLFGNKVRFNKEDIKFKVIKSNNYSNNDNYILIADPNFLCLIIHLYNILMVSGNLPDIIDISTHEKLKESIYRFLNTNKYTL